MTPAEAEALAAATLAALDEYERTTVGPSDPPAADRERVASDLAGLRQCADDLCADDADLHAARYADNLRRTAALYGVTP